jgi:glycerol-3-phosphate dehydrogenase (NAD(P)+)
MADHHVAVLGSGTMGIALANAVASKGHRCVLWSNDTTVISEINKNHRNYRHFRDHILPSSLTASTSIEDVVRSSKLVIVAITSSRFREILKSIRLFVTPGVPIFSATKAIEHDTNMCMSEVVKEVLCNCVVGAISGPNIAHDIIACLPTAIVAACECSSAITLVREMMQMPTLRIFATVDLRGVELAGALKNVVAIAAGIASGLELGDNARSLLVALGLVEIRALGTKLGAQPETFVGLAGLGDLFLTSTSRNSRNHMVGVELGRGRHLAQILSFLERIDETAEGINTVRACRHLAITTRTFMPIADAVYKVVVEGCEPRAAVDRLFNHPDLERLTQA